MLDLYCVMTENCNLSCDHCYMSAGPKKKHTTVSSENFQKMLGHLPITRTHIALTGGEIFTVEDSLRDYLDLISIANEKREKKQRINVEIQTNGFWLKKRNARELLSYLSEKDVYELDISSADKYHQNQGLKIEEKFIELAKEYIPIVGSRGAENALPIGRANGIDGTFSFYPLMCKNVNKGKNSEVTIRNSGKVYPCCFPIFEYSGNVFEEPLLDILNRAKVDPRFIALNNHGLRGIALEDGIKTKELEKLILERGTCGACVELYGNCTK